MQTRGRGREWGAGRPLGGCVGSPGERQGSWDGGRAGGAEAGGILNRCGQRLW